MYHANVNVKSIVENVTRIEIEITINVGVSRKIKKKHHLCKKDYIWNPATCSSKNGKHLSSIIDNL